jgi:hypothetical protein
MPIRKRVGSGLLVAVALALLSSFVACSSDDTSSYPVVQVTPIPSVRSPYASGSHQNFASGDYLMYPLPLTVSGVLDVTVDWTFPTSWIYVYFGETRCSYEQLAGRTCPFLISSETQQPKPRVLVTQKLAAGQYYLVVYNVPWNVHTKTGSDNTETVIYQANITVFTESGARVPIRLGEPIVVPGPGR